jgi:hypothetical protein
VYVDLKQTINQSIVIEHYVKHINRLCQELAVKTWTECNYFHIVESKIRQIKVTERLQHTQAQCHLHPEWEKEVGVTYSTITIDFNILIFDDHKSYVIVLRNRRSNDYKLKETHFLEAA